MHSNLFFSLQSFILMSYKEIFIVLIVGFGLGYIFGIEVDPKIFPQPVETKIIREQILPDSTSSIAELVNVADRLETADVYVNFTVDNKKSGEFFERNLKWLDYYTNEPDSSVHKTFFKDTDKGVLIASVYYAP